MLSEFIRYIKRLVLLGGFLRGEYYGKGGALACGTFYIYGRAMLLQYPAADKKAKPHPVFLGTLKRLK
jgi:hypothetical protein